MSNGAEAVPMLFLRVAWMKFYNGQTADDEMTGGGDFVDQHGYGHEMFNFRRSGGRVYGYVRPTIGKGEYVYGAGIKLERLGAGRNDGELSGVLVVWVSSPPEGGTYIVGWYRNATVYRRERQAPEGSNRTYRDEDFGYYVTAAAADATLLESTARTFAVPHHQRGYIGQSNVWYADDPEHGPAFRRQVLRYIESRELPPAPKPAPGPARQVDPLLRCKVEEVAIKVTTLHFERQGYVVGSDEDDNLGWDLRATCGPRELKLEVKGLSGSGICVELTPNEFSQMQKCRDCYYVCVVTNALTDPKLAVFGYSPDSGKWQDDQKRTLQVETIIAARCRV